MTYKNRPSQAISYHPFNVPTAPRVTTLLRGGRAPPCPQPRGCILQRGNNTTVGHQNAGRREDAEVISQAGSGEILNALVFRADQVLSGWKRTNQSHHFHLISLEAAGLGIVPAEPAQACPPRFPPHLSEGAVTLHITVQF